MNANGDGFTIKSILVAIDSASTAAALLRPAALLAQGFHARLSGIFVEDINLLHLAGLPFARELTWSTAVELRIDYQRMERVLRGRGVHVRQAVVEVAREIELPMQVVRGQIAQELLRSAENMDLIILGKGGAGWGRQMGSVARRMLHAAQSSVLLIADNPRAYKAVMAIFTGHDRDKRALSAAAQAARLLGKSLLVLIPASNTGDYHRLLDSCRKLLGHGSLSVTYQAIPGVEAGFEPHRLKDEDVGLLVIHASLGDANSLETRLAGLAASLLLVR